VLAHGLFGFVRLGLGPFTLATYFRSIPDYLRAGGNRVLLTRVHPTAGIDRRARKLGERIQAAFPDEPVHIIGHSMGGLDARQLLTEPEWQGRVLSLTTVGTPHLGSTLAEAARFRLGGVYRLLESAGLDHRGFLDITPRAARTWHAATPAPEGLPCFSLAGDPSPQDICWPIRPVYALMERWEGANDGLVSVKSAESFGIPLTACPVDHLRQMNWLTSSAPGAVSEEVQDLYLRVLSNLVSIGFGAELPAVASVPPPAIELASPAPLAAPTPSA
jgi:triacylglycerol lipase